MSQAIERPVSQNILDELVTRIVDAMKPERIMLFGSYAYGQPTPDSDLDLVIVKRTDQPIHKRAAMARRIFWGTGIPVDILVYTPEEYDRYKDDPFSLLHQVHRKGKVLYG